MLADILKKFHKEQKGITNFRMPSGDHINLVSGDHRKRLKFWVLSCFDNDEDTAVEKVMGVVPYALTKNAPWPYLIKSLWNIASRKSAFLSSRSLTEVKEEFLSVFGKCRISLLNELCDRCDNRRLYICGVECDLNKEPDRVAFLEWLLKHPQEVFHVLSPQNHSRLMYLAKMQVLISSITKAKMLSNLPMLESLDTEIVSLFKEVTEFCIPGSELKEVAAYLTKFYTANTNPLQYTYLSPSSNTTVMLSEDKQRKKLYNFLVDYTWKNQKPNDMLKCDWLGMAVRLGIVTHPLNWVLHVLTRNKDQVEEWMDHDWYSIKVMSSRYGLKQLEG